MFVSVSIPSNANIDDSKIRLRCQCGTERSPMKNRTCPNCGAKAPVAIALDGITWKTMAQHKLETLRQLLQPGALDKVPEEQREMARQMIKDQLASLETTTES